jgi:hypothetical protein
MAALRNSSYGVSVAIFVAVAVAVAVVGTTSAIVIAYNIAKARRYDQRMKGSKRPDSRGPMQF